MTTADLGLEIAQLRQDFERVRKSLTEHLLQLSPLEWRKLGGGPARRYVGVCREQGDDAFVIYPKKTPGREWTIYRVSFGGTCHCTKLSVTHGTLTAAKQLCESRHRIRRLTALPK